MCSDCIIIEHVKTLVAALDRIGIPYTLRNDVFHCKMHSHQHWFYQHSMKSPSSESTQAPVGPSDWDWVAWVLHFSDSALPVGAYAHSFGLEGVCQMGLVHDKETLRTFLNRDVSTALVHVDLPLVAKSHEATMDGRYQELVRLDRLSWALRPTRQLREAASRIGKQQMQVYQNTWADAELPMPELPYISRPPFWACFMLWKMPR